MALRFYNTMTRKLEEFKPIEPGKVRMYTCGPRLFSMEFLKTCWAS